VLGDFCALALAFAACFVKFGLPVAAPPPVTVPPAFSQLLKSTRLGSVLANSELRPPRSISFSASALGGLVMGFGFAGGLGNAAMPVFATGVGPLNARSLTQRFLNFRNER